MLDSFLPNLLVFLIGQVAAWAMLRTGLVQRGVLVLVATWCLADLALVARLGFGHDGAWFVGSLVVMHALSLWAAGWFVVGRLRRRRPAVLARRDAALREGLVAYLHGDLATACSVYARLVRSDPWDHVARLWLAMGRARLGDVRGAGASLRRARNLDRDQRYADVVRSELARLRGAAAHRPEPPVEPPLGPSAVEAESPAEPSLHLEESPRR